MAAAITVGQIIEQARQRFPSDPDAKELWVDEQLQLNVIDNVCTHIGNALEERKAQKQVFVAPIDRPKDHFARTSGNRGLKMCKPSAAKYDFNLTAPRMVPPKIDPMVAISMAASALAKSMSPPSLTKQGTDTEPPSPQRQTLAVVDDEKPEPEQELAKDHVVEAPPHQRRNSPLPQIDDNLPVPLDDAQELPILDKDDDTKTKDVVIVSSMASPVLVADDEPMAIDLDLPAAVVQSSGRLKHKKSKKTKQNDGDVSEEDMEFMPGDGGSVDDDAYEYASHDNTPEESSVSGDEEAAVANDDEEKVNQSLVEEEIVGDVAIPDLQQRARQLFRPLGPNDDESITDGESSRCGFDDDDNYTDVVVVAETPAQESPKKRTIHQTTDAVVVSSPKQQAANGVHPLILEQVEKCAKEHQQQQQRSSSYATFSKDELKEAFRLELDRIVYRGQSKIEKIFQKLRPLLTEPTVDLSEEEQRSLSLYCRYIDGFLINCQMRLSGPNILSSMAEHLYALDEHPRLRFIMEQLRSCYRSSARCISDDQTKFSDVKKESSSGEGLKCFLTGTDWTPQQHFQVIRLGENCMLSMQARSTFFVLLLDFAFHTRDSLLKHIVANLKQKTGLNTLAEAAAVISQNYETTDDFVDAWDKQYSEWFIGMWTRAHSRLSAAIERVNRTVARLANDGDDDD